MNRKILFTLPFLVVVPRYIIKPKRVLYKEDEYTKYLLIENKDFLFFSKITRWIDDPIISPVMRITSYHYLRISQMIIEQTPEEEKTYKNLQKNKWPRK
jgi:hypothetical protein